MLRQDQEGAVSSELVEARRGGLEVTGSVEVGQVRFEIDMAGIWRESARKGRGEEYKRETSCVFEGWNSLEWLSSGPG